MKLQDNTHPNPASNPSRDTARAILIRDNEILLIERWRNGEHYFSIPGGGTEHGETPEQTVLRELLEETTIIAVIEKQLYKWAEGSHTHYFYLCSFVSGTAHLPDNAEEASKGSDNIFKPRWVTLNTLDTLPFGYWKRVADELIQDINIGILPDAKVIDAL